MLLAAEGVHKAFGGVRALRGAEFGVAAGEVHGLAGANGSGKSTLLRILSGQLHPDAGHVVVNRERVRFTTPRAALAAGVGIVTQETTLVPTMAVEENVLLGRRGARRMLVIDRGARRRRACQVLDRLGVALDPARRVATLAPPERQLVEIARALARETRVLILDEPTSSLTEDRVEALFAVVRALREEGVAIVFVSHRPAELLAIADRVTVLRDGRAVAAGPAAEFDASRLLREIAGEEPVASPPSRSTAAPVSRLLEVSELDAPPNLRQVSFGVSANEAIGLAGLVGAGRSELLGALFGLVPRGAGAVRLDGAPLRASSPRTSIRRGIAYVPADRRACGLLPQLSLADNLALAATSRANRLARRDRARERLEAASWASRLAIDATAVGARAGTLSGGNQQKVILGRWLATDPRLVLLDEPTRGVDIAAKAEIHAILRRARDAGAALVISSSETEELLELCDRVLVMARGRVVAELAAEQATEATISHYAAGHLP